MKCFAKDKSGKANFYKDGYTDLRGRFDYTSVTSFDLSNFEKFSIFVMSDEYGNSLLLRLSLNCWLFFRVSN